MNDLVLLTGSNGLLGAHTALALLRSGFRVRATARDARKAASRFDALVPPEQRERLDLVSLDLMRDEGWESAADGCTYVVHTASPVPSGPVRREEEVIEPARQGALRALRAARSARVKRVVLTSSTAAVLWGHTRDGSRTFNEDDWTLLGEDVAAYEKSKTLAEHAAWDYVSGLPEGERFELVTILPGAILGPLLDREASVSGEIVRVLLARAMPGVPDLGFALVDVRDAADMHVAALTAPGAAGQRFLIAGPHTPMREIAAVLSRHFGPRGFRIPSRALPSVLVRLMALWDANAALTARELGKRQDVSSGRARATLGFQPRSAEEMIVAMGESMVRLGIVSP